MPDNCNLCIRHRFLVWATKALACTVDGDALAFIERIVTAHLAMPLTAVNRYEVDHPSDLALRIEVTWATADLMWSPGEQRTRLKWVADALMEQFGAGGGPAAEHAYAITEYEISGALQDTVTGEIVDSGSYAAITYTPKSGFSLDTA